MRNWQFLALALVATSPVPVMAQTAAPTTVAATDPNDKVSCRREEVTGSKVRAKKVCMTKREWTKLWDHTRQETTEMEQRNPRIGCLNSAGSGVC